jgi:predicted transcriptional regulator
METLTKKEEKIMQILWKIKKGFIKDIIGKIKGEKPPYNTISSIVRILVKKDFVGYKQYGNTYEYFTKIGKKKYRKMIFKSMISNYFDDSYQNVVSFMAKEKKMKDEEIDDILKTIKKSEEKK